LKSIVARDKTEGQEGRMTVRTPDTGHTGKLAAALAIGLLVGTDQALAADDNDTAPAADEGYSLQEVVVTSTRREESLSRVPISVTALTQDQMDTLGIKDITDVARFTPGINVDNSGTGAIAIRGVASSGGAGTTGIYIDDTPIQIRALAFNPDETLPKTFDIDRVEVLRGPQGTLFGAGSEGGTVRYITTQPSLTQSSIYSRAEVSYTEGGEPSYEAGVAAGGPIIDGTLGARATVWYRRDGGWIDRVDPTAPDPQTAIVDSNVNHSETVLVRLAGIWAPTQAWKITPAIYYQNRQIHDADTYWPIYSNPGSDKFISGAPQAIPEPDKFYLPSLKIEGDLGPVQLVSNTSYYHREDTTGYDGTLYNLGFYQLYPSNGFTDIAGNPIQFVPGTPYPLLDDNGIHLPASFANYRSPATVDNDQQNLTQELRLLSSDKDAKFVWIAGVFFSLNHQQYLEQIHDPLLNEFWTALAGEPYTDIFFYTDQNGDNIPVTYNPAFPNDSYFLQTHATDEQIAGYGEGTYAITDQLKATVGVRYSHLRFYFNTLTGGPQLFLPNQLNNGDKTENAFTPKLDISYQLDPNDLFYATYAKGFRPGGANNPVPQVACSTDFANFGITAAPATFSSDTVDSYEIGAKNNFDNRFKIASSIYYIRWHNIQQRIVPPICQISFIANLGQAAVKGADIQSEFAFTDHFSGELTAGYTQARFIANSAFTSNLVPGATPAPIVQNGDAIVGESGQPVPPVTASAGLEYHFTAFEHDSFVRGDYEYTGRARWTPPGQDPDTQQFSAANFTLSATNFVSLRAGMKFGEMQLEPFIDNLFDTHTITNYNFSVYPGPGTSQLLSAFSFRPRTFGVTFTYRH
jgi:iron complex outermembrane receptor protein